MPNSDGVMTSGHGNPIESKRLCCTWFDSLLVPGTEGDSSCRRRLRAIP
ncbi:hypothetical protein Pd630_LPD07617 [Rhodococcus opacus PD630]|nr:hypothetical protein Pd630_LPD07617 [Rhodococcus opacus PD630]